MTGRPSVYDVSLDPSQVNICKDILYGSKANTTVKKRCNILLNLNYREAGISLQKLANKVCCSVKTFFNVAKKFCEEGLESVINLRRNKNSDEARRKIDDHLGSLLLTMMCGPAPKGRKRWTYKLANSEFQTRLHLADDEKFHDSTLWRYCDKNKLKPNKSKYWCLPEVSPSFVLHMEDILDIYARSYNPDYPVVNMDECSLQLLADVRESLKYKPGQPELKDSEYKRLGTKNIFLFTEPKRGLYYVHATEQRTACDWAHETRYLVDVLYPNVKKIILVQDNLNTHLITSLYKAFPPEEASRICDRLEIHYTPTHGSWLNMAEIGINIMKTECIPNRFESEEEAENLSNQLLYWEISKNNEGKEIQWTFSPEKSRVKLQRLYDFSEYKEISTSEKYSEQNKQNSLDTGNGAVKKYLNQNAYKAEEPISSLLCCVNGEGKEIWSLNLAKKVELLERTGKAAVCASLGRRRNTSDGWPLPLPKKKNKSSSESWIDYDFMAYGEDVVKVYSRPYRSEQPVICINKRPFDLENLENNTWLSDLKHEPQVKKTKKEADEENKEESATSNTELAKDNRIGITLAIEPLTGKKYFRLSDYADSMSWGEMIQDLVDNQYKDAEKITIILNESDLVFLASLEVCYTPDEALRLYRKLDIHVVPERASWLNICEIESIVLLRKCLTEGVNNVNTLAEELISWKNEKSLITLKLDISSFRSAFDSVYQPIKPKNNDMETKAKEEEKDKSAGVNDEKEILTQQKNINQSEDFHPESMAEANESSTQQKNNDESERFDSKEGEDLHPESMTEGNESSTQQKNNDESERFDSKEGEDLHSESMAEANESSSQHKNDNSADKTEKFKEEEDKMENMVKAEEKKQQRTKEVIADEKNNDTEKLKMSHSPPY